MPKWKILNKTKKNKPQQKQEIDISIAEKNESIQQPQIQKTQEKQENSEFPNQTEQKKEPTPIKTYKETLYSSDHPIKKKTQIHQRQRWENAETIGKNIDSIDSEKKHSSSYSNQSNRIEDKIDCLLSRKGVKKQNDEKEKTSDIPEGYIAKKNKRTGLTYYTKK